MLTLFVLLAVTGGALRLALQWGVRKRWGIIIVIPQALAGALVVLAGFPEFLKSIPFPVLLAGEYDEPGIKMITAVISQGTLNDS